MYRRAGKRAQSTAVPPLNAVVESQFPSTRTHALQISYICLQSTFKTYPTTNFAIEHKQFLSCPARRYSPHSLEYSHVDNSPRTARAHSVLPSQAPVRPSPMSHPSRFQTFSQISKPAASPKSLFRPVRQGCLRLLHHQPTKKNCN